jgi:hypothetical protein
MPARGRHRLSWRRLQRVADKLHELYGPDENSLREADWTGEVDWEGAPVLRGLPWAIEKITRELYDQDRQHTADLYPREYPESIPANYRRIKRTRGRRCNYAPGGREFANNVKHPPPRYVDKGETAEEGRENEPPELPPDYVPESRQAYVNRQQKRELMKCLDGIMRSARSERQREIRRV